MRCVYINLESRTDRRAALEANFEANKAAGWTLSRIDATRADQPEAVSFPGPTNPREKGVLPQPQSRHRRKRQRRRTIHGPRRRQSMFGPRSCVAIERVISNLASDSWDLLFTDVAIANVGVWADIIRIRRQHFARTGEMRLVDLAGIDFSRGPPPMW